MCSTQIILFEETKIFKKKTCLEHFPMQPVIWLYTTWSIASHINENPDRGGNWGIVGGNR